MKIIIAGCGNVGRLLAGRLSREGHDIVMIDENADLLAELDDEVDALGIQGDATDVAVLKEAGAQAISINGERIVPTSEVLCLGPSIRVNGVRLFAPYRISAVGDADTLLKAYQESRIYSTIVTQNLLYDVQKSDRIVIGSFTGNQEKLISNLH